MTTFRATPHAAERFQERVRPTLDVAQAGAELVRLLAAFGEQVEWEQRGDGGDHCYEIAPGLWVPCFIDQRGRTVAVTVITEDWLPPEIRERRNDKRARRKAKKARALAQRHEGRRAASMREKASRSEMPR